MKVCIAEKPSVAREIAKILNANTKRDGYFEGNGYAVTYTFGHLCTLFEPNDYKPYWKKWDLNNLPMLPDKFNIKVNSDSGIQKQFQIIKGLFEKAEVVINCGDAGQEGELIQRWVLAKAKNTKPLKRLWISSLTEEAIKEGFSKLEEGSKYDNLYAAVSARAIGDRLLGMNATRLFTIRFGKKGQVLSVGRVQTPTLAMIVTRQLEIDKKIFEDLDKLEHNYHKISYIKRRINLQKEYLSAINGRKAFAEKLQQVIHALNRKNTKKKEKTFLNNI